MANRVPVKIAHADRVPGIGIPELIKPSEGFDRCFALAVQIEGRRNPSDLCEKSTKVMVGRKRIAVLEQECLQDEFDSKVGKLSGRIEALVASPEQQAGARKMVVRIVEERPDCVSVCL
jgi:hypothetical protein